MSYACYLEGFEALPGAGIVDFLRNHDFINQFDVAYVWPVGEFIDSWGDAEHEFQNAEIEQLRIDLMAAADDLSKHIGKGLGVTINDVFLCCAAGALRRLLRDKHYDPDQHPLIAGTPFAGPRPEGWQGLGNFATADYCWLHSEIEDPLKRLQASHKAAVEMKEHMKATLEAGADLSSLLQICPPWVLGLVRWYINRQQGGLGMFGNLVLSNVPGPREPIFFNTYKLDDWFSTGQVFDGSCINITLWSYCQDANLCILADEKVIPDGWVLFEYFVAELDRLLEQVPTATEQEATA
jgi:diacylglycerol O-acyltransferase